MATSTAGIHHEDADVQRPYQRAAGHVKSEQGGDVHADAQHQPGRRQCHEREKEDRHHVLLIDVQRPGRPRQAAWSERIAQQ
ncbi:hypothetical protein KM539_00315 [Xanthomonas translucens pv. poae]|uniref:hypothetical protein n=1 Tax=Xanthomonas graminis TaxID=3390026 RepID=UPI001112CE7D|nr:hypothetical protein [Xanthomonas translucens]UKE62069.1 hypothetical protein KM539_00315 [Xanthomonas translucens pv. poae]